MTARKKLLAAALSAALPLVALAQTTPPPADADKPAASGTVSTPAGTATATAPEKAPEKKAAAPEDTVKVTPYGFVQLSGFWDDKTFATRDYPGQVNATNDGGSFLMSARYSRFGVRLATKDNSFTGAELTGVLEFDFKAGHLPTSATCGAVPAGGGTPTCTITGANTASTGWYNGLMRLRLAAMTASWKGSAGSISVLAGQEYGLVNPLFAETITWTADPIFWQAGNLWRRSPQIRLTVAPTIADTIGFVLQGAILSPADASTPVDWGAGNKSRQPDLEARAAVTLKASKDMNGTLGIGYHTNKRRYAGNAATPFEDVTVHVWGADAEINVPFVGLKGEYFDSKGADDTYFGIIANPVGSTIGNRTLGRSTGYWGQAIVKPLPAIWLTVGYGQEKANRDDLTALGLAAATTRLKNEQLTAGVIANAGKFWRFGVEWCQTTTEYLNGTKPDGQQIAVSSQLKF